MRILNRLLINLLIISIISALSTSILSQADLIQVGDIAVDDLDNSYLFFSTFLGGNDNDEGFSIVIDDDENIYVTGFTDSTNFPTKNAYNEYSNGGSDVFLSSFTSDGELRWSTYFGGSEEDNAEDIAIDSEGNIYISGHTRSTDFPLVNAFDTDFSDFADGFIASFFNNGSLRWSSYLGGEKWDDVYAISIDSEDNILATGITESTLFPMVNAHDDTFNGGNNDAFVTSILPNGTISWSTFIGGADNDYGKDLVIDSNDRIHVGGFTYSNNFPTLNAYQDNFMDGWSDGIMFTFEKNGSLLMSTYIGGSEEDTVTGIAVDSKNNIYLTGFTHSSDFPRLNADDPSYGGGLTDVFISSFNNTGELRWSTFHGGSNYDDGYGITVDADDVIHVIGQTFSTDFETLYNFGSNFGGEYDIFTGGYNTNGKLLWTVKIIGIDVDKSFGLAVDKKGNAIITGKTLSANFPTNNAHNSTFGGGRTPLYAFGHDVFVSYVATPVFDYDGDRLNNYEEYRMGLDIRNNDTDSDGMTDGWEYEGGLNAKLDDSQLDLDGDLLINIDEFNLGTWVNDSDTDSDFMPDGWEVQYGLNPLEDDSSDDLDGDGFNNLYEYQHNMDPTVVDIITSTILTEPAFISISLGWVIIPLAPLSIVLKRKR